MSESEAAKVAAKLQGTNGSVWTTEAEGLVEQIGAAVAELAAMAARGGADPGAGQVAELERELAEQTKQATIAKDQVDEAWTRQSELEQQLAELDKHNRELAVQLEAQAEDKNRAQASAVSAERVAELERQLADAGQTVAAYSDQIRELERQLAEAYERLAVTAAERDHGDDLLTTAYVAREVPWSDVAAGMMTIARDGTPWMVQDRVGEQVFLRQGEKSFPKDPKPGETVRVLVPYVTPEQAEALVASELGGRA